MTQTKSIVVAALFAASTSAVTISYRPPAGSVPWQIPVTVPQFESPDHPVDYFVPNFGKDSDVINVTNAIAQSELTLKKKLHADFGANEPGVATPRNYFVPDFGVDRDIINTTGSITQAEAAVGSTLTASFEDKKNPVNPRNYFVPDFGVDHEILGAQNAIAISEKKLKHKLMADFGANEPGVATPRNYVVPDFGVDRDIINTTGSITQAEASLSHVWTPVKSGDFWDKMPAQDSNSSYVFSNTSPEFSAATKTNGSTAFVAVSKGPKPPSTTNIQLDAESDPICSSAGCTQYKMPEGPPDHPMDYFVPNFGVDHHIMETENSEKWASKEIGHTWVWVKEDKKDPVQYKIEPLDVDMQSSLSNLRDQENIHGMWDIAPESLVQLQSDPICSSAGCTQYMQPDGQGGVPDHPMDYFVPDFGVDHDIISSFNGLTVAEKLLEHKLNWVKTEKPDHLKGETYKVPDFGLDQDIIGVNDGLAFAERELQHKWKPVQDKDGFWTTPENSYNGTPTLV